MCICQARTYHNVEQTNRLKSSTFRHARCRVGVEASVDGGHIQPRVAAVESNSRCVYICSSCSRASRSNASTFGGTDDQVGLVGWKETNGGILTPSAMAFQLLPRRREYGDHHSRCTPSRLSLSTRKNKWEKQFLLVFLQLFSFSFPSLLVAR